MKLFFFISILCTAAIVQAQQLPGFSSQGSPSATCEGLAFNSDEEAFNKVKQICDAMDIAGNFMVAECAHIDNCKAILNSSGSYIFYNKAYLQKIKGLSFTEASFQSSKNEDWDVVCILAHEIGHHILQHLANFQQLSRIMPLVDIELEADKFAGACMYRLGATLEQAQHVMYDASISEKASLNHPGRKERLDAIALGYNKVKAKSTNTPIVPTNMPVSDIVSNAITLWSEGKYEKAVEIFEKFESNEKVWGYLGSAYFIGIGTKVDFEKAVKYLSKAADNGNADSQYALGYMYYRGYGVSTDYLLAQKYFSMAAEQNYPGAMSGLGDLYLYGRGVPVDYEKAIKYYEKGASFEEPGSLNSAAMMYYQALGIELNFSKALDYYKKLANQKNAEGQYWYGRMHELGEGVKKNMDVAIEMYQLAARQEHNRARESCNRLNVSW